MKQYLDLMQYVLDNGDVKSDRTGVGTISSFGHHLKFDLREREGREFFKTFIKDKISLKKKGVK